MTVAVPHRLGAGVETRSRFVSNLCVAALAMGLFSATMSSEALRILLKWLVDPLLHTTSAGGVFLVLATAIAASLVLALDARGLAAMRPSTVRLVSAVLVAAIVMGHGAVLVAQVAYAQEVGMPAMLPAYHWNGADNTYTFLLHSHVGKALLAGFDPEIAQLPGRYDTGRALRGAVVPGSCRSPSPPSWEARSPRSRCFRRSRVATSTAGRSCGCMRSSRSIASRRFPTADRSRTVSCRRSGASRCC
jgi:hypothetical protein